MRSRTKRCSPACTAPGLAVLAVLAGCGGRTTLHGPDGAEPEITTEGRSLVPAARCVEVDPAQERVMVDLATDARLLAADVVLVMDRTGSMTPEIENIRRSLRQTIVPQTVARIPDVEIGVVSYGDFPIEPYGDPGEAPFSRLLPVGADVDAVQATIDGVHTSMGGDDPEALTEALFQTASGEGYEPWIPRAAPCAASERRGGLCFRPAAAPVFVVITDAPAHDGTVARNDYDANRFRALGAARGPHTFDEAVAALGRVGARVLGINCGTEGYSGRADLEAYARATRAVDAAGAPLVFDLAPDGSGLDARVVDAITTFAESTRFDASARATVLDPAAAGLVRAARPAAAVPADGVQRQDDAAFYGVVPGTRLTFTLELDPARVPRGNRVTVLVRVDFLADGHASLGSETLAVTVGGACPR